MFTGNIGRFQGLEELTSALLHPDGDLARTQLVLMGEGAAKSACRSSSLRRTQQVRGRVVFLPHGTVAEAKALIRSADYGLVSLVPGIIRYAFPSKTATYLGEQTPLFVMVESDSELARFVETEHVGLAVADRRPATLLTVLRR